MYHAHLAFYALSILAGLVGGMGDVLLNKWAKTGGNVWWLGGGYACWLIALTLFVFMLKWGFLAHCVVLFLLANCLFVIAASNLVFHEPISAQKWCGIGLAITAIVVMELG